MYRNGTLYLTNSRGRRYSCTHAPIIFFSGALTLCYTHERLFRFQNAFNQKNNNNTHRAAAMEDSGRGSAADL